MMRKVLLGLVLGLATSCAYAQTAPSPADVGISKGRPDVFKLKGQDNAWTPFGSVDPSTHIYVPATNGAIAPNDCVKWGPGLTSAGAACNSVTGGAHPANQLTIYTNHSGLVANVTTPTEAWTVIQQGFYAPGDGGGATYQWNLTSYCGGTSGAPVTADGINCVLPIGQAPSVAGRYLLQTSGGIDVRQVGMQIGGADNSPLLSTLMNTLGPVSQNGGGPEVVFPGAINKDYVPYYFSNSFVISRNARYRCGSGRQGANAVELVFAAGVQGVVQEDGAHTSDGQYGQGAVDGCTIISMGMGTASTTPSSSTITSVAMRSDFGGTIPVSTWHVGDGIIAVPGLTGFSAEAALLAVPPGAYVSGVSGSTLTLASGFTTNAALNSTQSLIIHQLPAALKFTVQTTAGSNSVLVTGGPRLLVPGEAIWSDAFPFGTMVLGVSGTLGAQTVGMATGFLNAGQNASMTHGSGSPGQMWVMPAALKRDIVSNSSNNVFTQFPVGLQMACNSGAGLNCTGSYDKENYYQLDLIGRWTAGNNTSASSSINEKGARNFMTDFINGATLGEVDVNFNSNSGESGSAYYSIMGNCGNQNYSVMLGGYIAGGTGSNGCANPSGFFPPTPGSPWLNVGLQAGPLPTGTPTIGPGEMVGGWSFKGGATGQNCAALTPTGVWFIFGVSYAGCGTLSTMGLGWEPTISAFSWALAGEGDVSMRQFSDNYLGYFPAFNTAGVSFPQGLEIGNSGDYVGQERLLDHGSAPSGLPRLFGDVRLNTRPDLNKNLGWMNTQAFATTLAAAVTAGTTTSVAVAACPSPALPAGTNIAAISNINAPPILLDQVLGTLASCVGTTLTLNAASTYNSASGTPIQFLQWRPVAPVANDPAGTSFPVAAVTDISDLVACRATTVGFGVVNNGVAVGTAGYGTAVSAAGSSTRPVFCDGTSWTYH